LSNVCKYRISSNKTLDKKYFLCYSTVCHGERDKNAMTRTSKNYPSGRSGHDTAKLFGAGDTHEDFQPFPTMAASESWQGSDISL
jgi:hypothetical protein